MLSHCHYVATPVRLFVFNRLTSSLAQPSKRRQCNIKQEFSELEYPEISSNMIALGKNKKKTRSVQTNSSNSEHSYALKSVSSDIWGVFWNTLLLKKVIVSLDFWKMAWISSDKEEIINLLSQNLKLLIHFLKIMPLCIWCRKSLKNLWRELMSQRRSSRNNKKP